MEALEISAKKSLIQTNPSYFGGEEEEDIPDMADFEDPDNLIESDPVTCYFCSSHPCCCPDRKLRVLIIVYVNLIDVGNTSDYIPRGSWARWW